MPSCYLMLDFEMTEDVEKLRDGKKRSLGKEHLKFTMIDTETGKVIEMDMDVLNAKQNERQPKWGETHAAGQVLGKDPGKKINQAEIDRLQAELNSYREKAISAENQIRTLKRERDNSRKLLEEAQQRDFDPETREMMAAALDVHIEELAMSQQLDAFQKAKRAFKRLTGRSWVDEGGDGDDEEDD